MKVRETYKINPYAHGRAIAKELDAISLTLYSGHMWTEFSDGTLDFERSSKRKKVHPLKQALWTSKDFLVPYSESSGSFAHCHLNYPITGRECLSPKAKRKNRADLNVQFFESRGLPIRLVDIINRYKLSKELRK